MVDCFDRIAVHMTELALEPVRQLKTLRMLGAVSLRTPSNGHRFLVTISKRFPDGEGGTPRFDWSIQEVDGDGVALADGLAATSLTGQLFVEPDDAYWAAVSALCDLTAAASTKAELLAQVPAR